MREQRTAAGHSLWRDAQGPVEVRFLGRGPDDRQAAAATGGAPSAVAWSQQVHSARVLDAEAGPCGEGDGLVTREPNLALCVVTADCVPVLIAGESEVASAHAGWRGIVAEVVAAALDRLSTPAGRLTAWLGPAIGPCCYEVGDQVAARVAAASGTDAIVSTSGPRPHLDLHRAVDGQLRQGGVRTIHRIPVCTRCAAARLHSYRRDGPRAGRNLSFIWWRA